MLRTVVAILIAGLVACRIECGGCDVRHTMYAHGGHTHTTEINAHDGHGMLDGHCPHPETPDHRHAECGESKPQLLRGGPSGAELPPAVWTVPAALPPVIDAAPPPRPCVEAPDPRGSGPPIYSRQSRLLL